MSASGPARSRKSASRAGGEDRVEGGPDLVERQAGSREARPPDRHVAAVDQDHDGVGQDADEREAEARLGPVRPQPDQQHPVGEGEQRQPKLVRDADPGGDRGFGAEADRHRGEEQRHPDQPDRAEVPDVAAGEQAQDQAEDDRADQHRIDSWEFVPEPASVIRSRCTEHHARTDGHAAPRRGRQARSILATGDASATAGRWSSGWRPG